ncbi:hypothetical protein TNCT_463541 [Trichonephila clavata]|uniref:Uncharacterized protein n=1 Tax=Trichonephila clavata TaxID=2740835 RepID=A0A8X6LCH3_TRICU|nr:hypothetical protein TNCT_463541 [Trichonephila clavata]
MKRFDMKPWIPLCAMMDLVVWICAVPKFYAVDPLQQVKIYTGLVFEFKAGWTAFLKDKSSVVTRKHLVVEGGVIDPGHRR